MVPNQQAATAAKQIWPLIKNMVVGLGISAATAIAAHALIPDSAVMTKEELENNTELSTTELVIRKSAIPLVMTSLFNAPKNIVNISKLFKTPGVESKVRATAALLIHTPGFYTAFKTLKHRYEEGEGTLNIREIMPHPSKAALAGAPAAGSFLNGLAAGISAAPTPK